MRSWKSAFGSRLLTRNTGLAAMAAAVGLGFGADIVSAEPISYQGRFTDAGAVPDGSYDLNLQLFNAAVGGTPVGPALQRTVVLAPEDNGLFSFVDLDFGAVFNGQDLWIELSVRQTGAGAFTTLAPRQPILATPYAQFARQANTTLDQAYDNGSIIFNDGLDPLTIRGLTHFGFPSQANGFTRYFMGTSASHVMQFGSVNGFGGQAVWYDENASVIGLMQGDTEGTGLFARFIGNGGNFVWDADLGTGPNSGSILSITGPVSAMSFNTGAAGDNAFMLPDDVIGQDEIFGEAGIASDAVNAGVTLSPTFAPVLSRSISVPGPGNVIALANGSIAVQRATNANGILVLGVSDTPSALPDTQQNVLQLPIGGPAGFHNWPTSAHAVFDVPAAGTYTYYFNANSTGFGTPRIFDPNLTLIYIPTTYGDVTPTLLAPDGGYNTNAPVRGSLTEAELLRERLREQERALRAMQERQQQMEELLRQIQQDADRRSRDELHATRIDDTSVDAQTKD